jgi:hypothetical protein
MLPPVSPGLAPPLYDRRVPYYYRGVKKTSVSLTIMLIKAVETGGRWDKHFKKIYVKPEYLALFPRELTVGSRRLGISENTLTDLESLVYEGRLYHQIMTDILGPRQCLYFLPESPPEERKDLDFVTLAKLIQRRHVDAEDGDGALAPPSPADHHPILHRGVRRRREELLRRQAEAAAAMPIPSRVKRIRESVATDKDIEIKLLKQIMDLIYVPDDDEGPFHFSPLDVKITDRRKVVVTSDDVMDKLFEKSLGLQIAPTNRDFYTAIIGIPPGHNHNDYKTLLEILINIRKVVKFGQTSTLFAPNPTSLEAKLSEYFPVTMTLADNVIPRDFLTSIFQLFVMSFVLGLHGIEHNDLHIWNVLISNRSTEVLSNCKVANRNASAGAGAPVVLLDVSFLNQVEVLGFDWDFSHSTKLGNNSKLLDDRYFCGQLHHCNSIARAAPPGEQARASALRNIVTACAWICRCDMAASGVHAQPEERNRRFGRLIDFIINLISYDGKQQIVRELFKRTCISNYSENTTRLNADSKVFYKNRASPDRREAIQYFGFEDGEAGMEPNEVFLSPTIYHAGRGLFRSPLKILQDLGNFVRSPVPPDGAAIPATVVAVQDLDVTIKYQDDDHYQL